MLGAGAGSPAPDNPCLGRSKAAQQFYVFIINVFYISRAEKTLFFRLYHES